MTEHTDLSRLAKAVERLSQESENRAAELKQLAERLTQGQHRESTGERDSQQPETPGPASPAAQAADEREREAREFASDLKDAINKQGWKSAGPLI